MTDFYETKSYLSTSQLQILFVVHSGHYGRSLMNYETLFADDSSKPASQNNAISESDVT